MAGALNWSLVNFAKFDPSTLADINDLAFDTLGKNNKKFKWDELDYSKLDAGSLKDIDWSQVDFKKAGQSSSFDLAKVDWDEVNAGKTAKKIYGAIDWSNESIASEVAGDLNWSLVNFAKFDPSTLADINDLAFDTLGKNNKKFKWNELDFSALDAESLKDIDWTQVDFKKAGQSSSFDLAKVDWAEVNGGKTAKKIYKAIDWSNESIASEVAGALNWSLVNFAKFDPSTLADINDLAFETLGKNNKKFKWDELNYNDLNAESIKDIDWTQVDLLKASKSENFLASKVDWAEVSADPKALAKAAKLFASADGQNGLKQITADDITGLHPKAILGTKFNSDKDRVDFQVGTTSYALITTRVSPHAAAAASYTLGGRLAEFPESDQAEALADVLLNPSTGVLASNPTAAKALNKSTAKDGGGAAYLWPGASDAEQEGTWKWRSDDSLLTQEGSNWGSGALGSEPDNYTDSRYSPDGQDYLAIGLSNWPKGAADDQGFGNAGEWNDLAESNKLGFIVEFK